MNSMISMNKNLKRTLAWAFIWLIRMVFYSILLATAAYVTKDKPEMRFFAGVVVLIFGTVAGVALLYLKCLKITDSDSK